LRLIFIDFDRNRQIDDLHEFANLGSVILELILPRQFYALLRIKAGNRCSETYISIYALADNLCHGSAFILLPSYDKSRRMIGDVSLFNAKFPWDFG